MRILIASTQVPFISGGAEAMADQLKLSLVDRGHQAEMVTMPFIFNQKDAVMKSMKSWKQFDVNELDIGYVDQVICLKFPTFYLKHHNKVTWLTHQHRAVYDLWDTQYGEVSTNKEAIQLRNAITNEDNINLNESAENFTISKTVSERMRKYNGIKSQHVYQPSPLEHLFSPGHQYPYIFAPSRLESLKRQELLIEAASMSKTPCNILIAGTGGLAKHLQEKIEALNLKHKVKLLGHVSQKELSDLYSNALAIYFAPFNEDYGFITLEAMQSAKPVITCPDSGGPLEFITDDENGFVVEPNKESLAQKIDYIYQNKTLTKEMGLNGLARYKNLNLNWNDIIDTLLVDNDESI
ncbi:MAG: glycosyltransferase family 4 protein [Pseudomonadota bacterium]|nr:glycosyltransferase family 4 protein [Pseudomonadota bacterium]